MLPLSLTARTKAHIGNLDHHLAEDVTITATIKKIRKPRAADCPKLPAKLPTDLLPEVWQRWAPPGCHVYFDVVARRTQTYGPAVGTTSRSWNLYGDVTATILSLKEAWHKAVLLGLSDTNPFSSY